MHQFLIPSAARVLTAMLPAIAITAAASFASAHYDFVPKIENGKIYTAGHDDEATDPALIDVSYLPVGGFDFGEILDDPYNINDPGFNTLGPSAFQAGTQLRFQPLSISSGSFIQYWSGSGSPAFSPAPAGVSLQLAASPTRYVTYTPTSATVTTSPSASSLLIGTFASNGSIHVHLNASIFLDGAQDPDSIPTGAYLISFKLLNPGTSLADSDPLYIVFNNGLTEELHDAAIDAVASSIPEPTDAVALLPALALLNRRR